MYITKIEPDIAYIDTEMVAFNVQEDQVSAVTDILIVSIGTRCMVEHGIPPEILD